MGVKKVKIPEVTKTLELGPRPRLIKLVIKNFRCIGSTPITIDLDDIVVLVGPNNAGKSSILKAYEVIMLEGSNAGQLSIDDFPSKTVSPHALPEIELHTIVYDNSPGPEWIEETGSGEKIVRELWRWAAPGPPTRQGYNVLEKRWATEQDKERVPWGAPGVANSRRPQPHRVDAFASPDKQAGEIVDLLVTALNDRVKSHRSDSKSNKESDFAKLLTGIGALQKRIVEESQEQIAAVQKNLSQHIGRIFPGHEVVFDAKPEDDLDKALSLFKSNPQLLMGPKDGYFSGIDRQGSGARRTLLWTAIKLLADSDKKKESSQRPHILLLDEPEICLHPSAIREACSLLYDLPRQSDNWQVMVTTHSPCFIDFSRDHTSVVRVERGNDGQIKGTTIFRPSKAEFDGSDKDRLKLLNICDPYVAEFFFGGRTIIVEGDTEYTAFMHIIGLNPKKYENIHVVRARGKATIVSLCKILNQFGTPYAVLHDSDTPTIQRNDKPAVNPAWTLNEAIRVEVAKSAAATRLLASLPNFESAYLGEEVKVKKDKPYNVLVRIKEGDDIVTKISQLLDALIDFTKPAPAGAAQWASIEQLNGEVEKL